MALGRSGSSVLSVNLDSMVVSDKEEEEESSSSDSSMMVPESGVMGVKMVLNDGVGRVLTSSVVCACTRRGK